jgi:acyl dehydratase
VTIVPPLRLETPEALEAYAGREVALTDWLTITQERIAKFAEATDDRQWLHVDEERAARESPFGGTIAHGFLTLSLLSKFMRDALEIRGGARRLINYGLNRVRFISPVRAGSRIRARIALQSFQRLADACEGTFLITVELEGAEKPCCVAEWIYRFYP